MLLKRCRLDNHLYDKNLSHDGQVQQYQYDQQ